MSETIETQMLQQIGIFFSDNPNPMWIFDTKSLKLTKVNDSAAQLYGYSKEEMLEMTLLDLRPSSEVDQLLNEVAKNSQELNNAGIWKHKKKDGSTLYVRIISTPIEHEGNPCKLVVAQDVTDQELLREKLSWDLKVQDLQKDLSACIKKSIGFKEALNECLLMIGDFLQWPIGHMYFRTDHPEKGTVFRSSGMWYLVDKDQCRNFVEISEDLDFVAWEGILGHSAASSENVWLDIKETDSAFLRLSEANACELKVGYFMPVVVSGNTEAVLEFYSNQEIQDRSKIEYALESCSHLLAQLFERRKNLDALHQEKEKYRLIAENATDMIARHGPDGSYIYVSPASTEVMGYTIEELMGQSPYDFFHPNDVERVEQVHRKLFESDAPLTVEYRMRNKDGSYRWVETTSKVISDPITKELTEIQTITRDITERVQYEESIKQQSKLNQKIVNSLPGIFFMINQEGKVRRVNNKLKEVLNFHEQEDIIGNQYIDFIAPQEIDKAKKAFHGAFVNGNLEVEIHLRNTLNQNIPFLMSGTVDEIDGELVILGTGIMIQDRLEAEQALRTEKTFIDKALNSFSGLFYLIDEDFNFLRINDHYTHKLGYTKEEIQQMSPLEFYLDKDHKHVREATKEVFRTGESGSMYVQIKNKKTGELPYYYMTGTCFEENGKKYVLGTGVEITQQIQAEEDLRYHQKLLQEMMDQTKAIIYVKERDGTFKFVNQEFLNIFGLEHEQVIGKKDAEIIGEDDDKNIRLSDIEAIDSGKPVELEERLVLNGEESIYLSTKVPLKGIRGFENCVFGISTEITQRKQAETKVKESLKEKEILLTEIHHRVKNNLALVSGIMHLQAYQSNNDEVKQHLVNGQSRIQSIAIIHELLYQSESLSYINLKENISKLVGHIQSSILTKNDIKLNLDLEDIIINVNQAVPCALIVNELLTNIFKHAYNDKESGDVLVSLSEKNEKIYVQIKDDGAGLPEDFDLETPQTVGLTLVRTLVSQLEGNLDYTSDNGETVFTLSFDKMDIQGTASGIIEE